MEADGSLGSSMERRRVDDLAGIELLITTYSTVKWALRTRRRSSRYCNATRKLTKVDG